MISDLIHARRRYLVADHIERLARSGNARLTLGRGSSDFEKSPGAANMLQNCYCYSDQERRRCNRNKRLLSGSFESFTSFKA